MTYAHSSNRVKLSSYSTLDFQCISPTVYIEGICKLLHKINWAAAAQIPSGYTMHYTVDSGASLFLILV